MHRKVLIIIGIAFVLFLCGVAAPIIISRIKQSNFEEDLIVENTGDVSFTISDNYIMFTNNEDFLREVPEEFVQRIRDEIPIESFGVASETTFVEFDGKQVIGRKDNYDVYIFDFDNMLIFKEVLRSE
mgnify:CR=1 FL=1